MVILEKEGIMKTSKQSHKKNMIKTGIVVAAVLAVTVFCVNMVNTINQRMNESATSNLLNTTHVIEGTVESYIDQDLASLSIIGEVYKNGDYLSDEEIHGFCSSMDFEWIGVVDQDGNGVDDLKGTFMASDLLCYQDWLEKEQGYSEVYFGDSGRLQMTLWVPVYDKEKKIGTVFGDIILNKYYSNDLFTFYEGEGRSYLFDKADGSWILRSMGIDGVSQRTNDIYTLLENSGNSQSQLKAFQNAIEQGKTGTAVFNFKAEQSYVCFMPISSSNTWYIATVIPTKVLLKESQQVQQAIQAMLIILCLTLLIVACLFAKWQIKRTKEKEAGYREALFANISSHIDSAFLIYDKVNRETVFVSDNITRLLGLQRAWLQKDAGHLFDWCGMDDRDEQRRSFMQGTLSKAVIREVCIENEVGNASRHIRIEMIPADLDQEILVLTDITKDKEIQQSLLEAMQHAEEASHAKNEFMSSMSHDIRTPMNGIIGMTAIAAANLKDTDRVKDCLTKINDASAHLLNLINEILDMSQIESGKIELSQEPFNLAELIQNILNMNYPGIESKQQSLSVHIESMQHEEVIGDSIRFGRIVTNLISNAIKYTPEKGKIRLSLREKESVLSGYGCYELTVEDNGIGMSKEFQKRLFLPFEREEDVRISKIQGTGLGMSIVKNIVTMMMGEIQVISEKHQGSTFIVTMNLKLDHNNQEKDGKLTELPVLVVDDDDIICESVVDMLNDIGMHGEWANQGMDAIAMVVDRHQRKEDYLAVILDWKMPDMDGIETAKRIREEIDSNIPIIVLTAYDWSAIEKEAREAGIHEFMSKPIYKTKLKQKMLDIVDDSEEAYVQEQGVREQQQHHVLLVEDNELNMEIAVELLKMLHISADCAENGEIGVEMFVNSEPGTYDMIFMDVQMPKMNGYEATEMIRSMDREDSKTIPIIAMTADAFAKDIQAAYAAGMSEHLAKPIMLEGLSRVVSSFLREGKKAGDEGNE